MELEVSDYVRVPIRSPVVDSTVSLLILTSFCRRLIVIAKCD